MLRRKLLDRRSSTCGVLLVLAVVIGVRLATFSPATAQPAPRAEPFESIDVALPSSSTGSMQGTLAVRVHVPRSGHTRYAEGAPVIIMVPGGFDPGGIHHGLPAQANGIICITFLFPGGADPYSGLSSDGIYDYRGELCAAALRDVVLYAAGALRDSRGRTIDQIAPVPVLHDNIGIIGLSNGGNLPVATAALHGKDVAPHLRYIIQWETPVSSQIATRDFGRIRLLPGGMQADYGNPRRLSYDPWILPVDYSDLAFDPIQEFFPLVHDGNGDGAYTTVLHARLGAEVPDVNLNGQLERNEDFPLDTCPVDDDRVTYSRPVMHEIVARNLFGDRWPDGLISLDEAEAYWDLRESVPLYEAAVAANPGLEAMVLCGARDHVQAALDKPHIRQAFDGWRDCGAWVKINPSPVYLCEVDATLERLPLPDLPANTPPSDWSDPMGYAMPPAIPKGDYQLAAIYEMADRAQAVVPPPAAHRESQLGTMRDNDPRVGGWITYIDCMEVGQIAVHIRTPQTPRYEEGAPVIVNVSGFFTAATGFSYQLDPDALGAIYVTYLWPGEDDPRTGARSEGIYDYGGPSCLRALRDVVRFATGEITNVQGQKLDEIVDVPVLYRVAGVYAFSHSGIAATNVLALYGDELTGVRFFVGRENPTVDAMYPLEPGHWDDETGRPVHNPFYDPAGYTPTSISIDYSTVYWLQSEEVPEGRPAFRSTSPDTPDYICSSKHPRLWGKDYWSTGLLQALLDNGALTRETWPETLATPEEAGEHWPFRTTVNSYPALRNRLPDLRVMLVFAADDHVQTALDKPHIHQAYDGFHKAAQLWCRLNPDRAYVEALLDDGAIHAQSTGNERPGSAIPDNPANREPATWAAIRWWGYPTLRGANLNVLVPLAAVAEMCDRTYFNEWESDLDAVLHTR